MGTLTTVSLLDFDEEPEEELSWFHHIEAYLQDRTYPESATPDQRRSLRRMANKYIIVGSTLSGEDLTVNFSDVLQTKKLTKL